MAYDSQNKVICNKVKKISMIITFIIPAMVLYCSHLSGDDSEGSSIRHLKLARLLVNNIDQKNNEYTHDEMTITWKGIDGAAKYENRTDCSGFLYLIFEESYGYTGDSWTAWMNTSSRPLAEDFYEAISNEKGFVKIDIIYDILPGDILAVRYDADTVNTGHIMMINSVPVKLEDSEPSISGTVQYKVGVIDSSMSGHGQDDTRYISGSQWYDGVGKGIARIYTNAEGAFLGYTWSLYSTSEYYSMDLRHFVVGRFIEKYLPDEK